MRTPTPPTCQNARGRTAGAIHPGVPVPMVRHDKGRWRCPRCGYVHSTRPPSGSESLPGRVVLGEVLGNMSSPKRRRLLGWLSDQAKREFGIRPPGEGKGWWVVPLPSIAGTGWVALGVGRSQARGPDNNWRILAFTQTPDAAGLATLKHQIGDAFYQATPPTDDQGQVCGEAWLVRVLGVSLNPEEALERLWIIVGRTNAFSFRA